MASHLTPTEQRDRLRLIRSERIGPVLFRQLMTRYGTASEALAALPGLARRGGRKTPPRIMSTTQAEDEIARTDTHGATLLHLGTDDYPAPLAALPDAPPVLIVKGQIALATKDGIGIVGARNASAAGIRFTRQIAGDLGAASLTVISGLARGIDTAAHVGSLETGTIAVMAGGIDVIYPPENDALFEEIAERGLVVCEMPVGTRPQARHFPRRNRLISGLSRGVLVVEAALRSGSLITANYAAEQGRDVFAVPGSPLDPRHRGTNNLLRQGAILTESAADITEALNSPFTGAKDVTTAPELPFETTAPPPISDGDLMEKQVLVIEKLGPTPTEIDDLIRQTGLTPAHVLTILLELELGGRLDRHPGNKVSLV